MPVCFPGFSACQLRYLFDASPALPRYFQSFPNCWCLTMVQRGMVTLYISGSTHTARPGDVLLFPPGACYAVLPEEDAVHLTVALFTSAAALEADCLHLTAPTPALLCDILQMMQQPALQSAAQNSLMTALLLQLGGTSGQAYAPLSPPTLPERILDYLNEHFHEPLTLSDLSARFQLTPSHIIHVFKPLYGLSPIQYLNQRRIGQAQLLLDTSRSSVGEIAAQVGIANRNQFHSSFKKLVGVSPNHYRSILHCKGITTRAPLRL